MVGRLRRGSSDRERTPAPRAAPGRPQPGLRLVREDAYPDWEAVYQDNVGRVYAMMFAKVGNRADAEDLTAEVFLAALGPLRISASVGEVRAYLSATARTVLAGHWRRHYGREVTTLAELPELPAAEDPAPHGEGPGARTGPGPAADPPGGADPPADAAADMLAGLPEKYAQVLRLRFLQGYSVKDTAAEMGISVSNAKVLQHRALRRAAQVIEEEVGR